jgi:hypothetical protein
MRLTLAALAFAAFAVSPVLAQDAGQILLLHQNGQDIAGARK